MREQASQFAQTFVDWAARQADILGVALGGSHARNEATDLSDIDLVIITTTPGTYVTYTDWAKRFGTIEHQEIEDYGPVTSLRVWYAGGPPDRIRIHR
jgi:predicted nucleotidyltransferase